MVKKGRYSVALFYSTSGAIRGEKVAKDAGLEVKLIPTPRHLSSDCGISMRFDGSNEEKIRHLFAKKNVEYERIAPL